MMVKVKIGLETFGIVHYKVSHKTPFLGSVIQTWRIHSCKIHQQLGRYVENVPWFDSLDIFFLFLIWLWITETRYRYSFLSAWDAQIVIVCRIKFSLRTFIDNMFLSVQYAWILHFILTKISFFHPPLLMHDSLLPLWIDEVKNLQPPRPHLTLFDPVDFPKATFSSET